jgi:hypothetical protein
VATHSGKSVLSRPPEGNECGTASDFIKVATIQSKKLIYSAGHLELEQIRATNSKLPRRYDFRRQKDEQSTKVDWKRNSPDIKILESKGINKVNR